MLPPIPTNWPRKASVSPSTPIGQSLDGLKTPPRSEQLEGIAPVPGHQRKQISIQPPSRPAPKTPPPTSPADEMKREGWYTRSGYAALIMSYATGIACISVGDLPHVTPSFTRGIFIDCVFAFFALKNSYLRKNVLAERIAVPEFETIPFITKFYNFTAILFGISAGCHILKAVALTPLGLWQDALLTLGAAFAPLYVAASYRRRGTFFKDQEG